MSVRVRNVSREQFDRLFRALPEGLRLYSPALRRLGYLSLWHFYDEEFWFIYLDQGWKGGTDLPSEPEPPWWVPDERVPLGA